MTEGIIIAVLSMVGTLAGAYLANRKSSALIAYRLDKLEEKVDKHNSVIERTFKLEEQAALIEERIKVANHRIEDLEKAQYTPPRVLQPHRLHRGGRHDRRDGLHLCHGVENQQHGSPGVPDTGHLRGSRHGDRILLQQGKN